MGIGTNGHRADDDRIPDAVVEEVLSGRYDQGAPDLVAVSRLMRRLRDLADRPAPPPSPALAQILRGQALVAGRSPPGPGAAPGGDGPDPSGPRRAPPELAASAPLLKRIRRRAMATACTAAVVAVVGAAGAARQLPGPAQPVAGKIVRTVTPFELPEHSGSAPAPSPSSAAVPSGPPDVPGPPGHPTGTAPDGSVSDGGPSVGGGAESGPPPGEARATPGSTRPRQPGPPVPEQLSPPSSPVTVPAVPTPPRQLPGFRVDLAGPLPGLTNGAGHGTALLIADPVSRELCLTLVVSGRAPATSAHLHAGTVGATGPVVVTFSRPPAGAPTECVPVGDQLIAWIEEAPEAYYLEVHSPELVNGAIRGQLRR